VTRDDGVVQLHAHAIDSAGLPALRTARSEDALQRGPAPYAIQSCRDEGHADHDRSSGTSATWRIPSTGL
jgi:hypothetical protein